MIFTQITSPSPQQTPIRFFIEKPENKYKKNGILINQ